MSTAVRPKLHSNMQRDLEKEPIDKTSLINPKMRKKLPSTLPSRPPGSQASIRMTSRNSSALSSAASTARVRSGSAKLRSGERKKSVSRSEIDDNEEDGIRFINVPSSASARSRPGTPMNATQITQQEVLDKAQETECSRVYDVDLHACNIALIQNLEKFTKLKVLDLSCNCIRHIDNLDKNQELKELKLYDNRLTSIDNLEKLKALHSLQLQHNDIAKIGRSLQAQRELRILRLDNNALTCLDVREITALGHLTSLDISNNHIENIGAVNCLPALEELFARSNRIRTVSDLSRCKKLQEIDLSNNRLSDLSGLKNLPKLTVIHVAHNQLVSLKSIGKLKGLEELLAPHNRLTELGCTAVNHPNLQILDVTENHIEDWQQLCSLEKFEELVELYVSGNPFSLPGGAKPCYIPDLHAAIPQLQVLDGATLVRPTKRPTTPSTPLMRPMSASSIVSARQVEAQFTLLNTEMSNFEMDLSRRFDSIRQTMESLPQQAPSISGATASPTPRPMSKSGKRSRLKQAMEYAASIDTHTDRATRP